MNREWVLFHLKQAHEELATTIHDIETQAQYEYGEFWPAMQHLYHHLNTAWNSRNATAEQVDRHTDADFNKWSGFPTDLPMMEV